MLKYAFIVCFISVLLCNTEAFAQRLHLEVGGANFRAYPIAVPNLQLENPKTDSPLQDLVVQSTALLRGNVNLARALNLVPVQTYLDTERAALTKPIYNHWSNIGASGLILGTLASHGTTVKISLHFFDVQSGQEVLAKNCSSAYDSTSLCIHRFVDDVVELLTGDKGIFSSRIAYVQRTGKSKDIFLCDMDGGRISRLTNNHVLNLLPAWDKDGQYILFTSFLKNHADLYKILLSSYETTPMSQQHGLNMGAAVSPDGKRIALTLSVDGNPEIYTMLRDGSNLKRLTDSLGLDVSPTWSPDGGRIAFVSSRSGNPHIYVMQHDGSGVRRLTFQGNYNQEPDWSPKSDGQIVFTARDEKLKYDIFLVHPDTSVITRLTQDNGHNESPSHSPDGHHVVFTSTRPIPYVNAGKKIWMMDVDGNNQHVMLPQAGDYETPRWGPRLGY